MKNALLSILFLASMHTGFSQGIPDSLRLKAKGVKHTIHEIDSTNNQLQAKLDSLKLPGDSTIRASYHKADSIHASFQSKADSLQLAYQKPLNNLNEVSNTLQHKIDSLQKLKLPTTSYAAKLDSVNRLGKQKMAELNQKVESLKSNSTKNLKALHLPPEFQGQADKLQQSISGFNIPIVNGKIPTVGAGDLAIPGLQLPSGMNGLPLSTASIPGSSAVGNFNQMNLPGAMGEAKQLSDLNKTVGVQSAQIGNYGKEIQNVAKGELPDAKSIEKTAETELNKTGQMKDINAEKAEIEKYKKQLGGRPDSAAMSIVKEQAKQIVMQEAINHFAGKEELLKGAMDKMAKLKSRYSEVKSMAALPKRLPNPLKGKPLIERLVPGITLQFISEKNLLMDVNPSIAYKIYPKWKAGLGWSERITFDYWRPTILERVYGLRSYTEYILPKGFNVRADIELLNARIPPLIISIPTDLGQHNWEWSFLLGLKKEFKVYKSITGNIQTMYRIWSDHDRVPFPDRLNIRMGFEFPMKKKVKL